MFKTLVVNFVHAVIIICLLSSEQCHLYIAIDVGVDLFECVEDSFVAAEHQPVISVVEEIIDLALEFETAECFGSVGEKLYGYDKNKAVKVRERANLEAL